MNHRLRRIIYFRGEGRATGRNFFKYLLVKSYLRDDSGAALTDVELPEISERLQEIGKSLIE
jgi:hypothetical protein